MLTHITLKSANAKVGPIPVSTSSRATCPTSCAFATHNDGVYWIARNESDAALSMARYLRQHLQGLDVAAWCAAVGVTCDARR